MAALPLAVFRSEWQEWMGMGRRRDRANPFIGFLRHAPPAATSPPASASAIASWMYIDGSGNACELDERRPPRSPRSRGEG